MLPGRTFGTACAMRSSSMRNSTFSCLKSTAAALATTLPSASSVASPRSSAEAHDSQHLLACMHAMLRAPRCRKTRACAVPLLCMRRDAPPEGRKTPSLRKSFPAHAAGDRCSATQGQR